MDIYSWILTLAIVAGQLIRLPIGNQGGITLLDMVVILLCLFGLIKLKFKLKRPPLFIGSAFVFIFIAILSLVLTPLHLTSSEFLISFFYTVRFTLYIFLGWLIVSGAFPILQNIPKMFVFSGLSLAVLGLIQFIFLPDLRFLTTSGWDPHYFRTVSTFLDPNFIGAFFVLTFILFLSLREGSLRPTWQSILIFATIYLALLTTFSRSSYLMFLISGLTLSFLKKSKSLGLTFLALFAILLSGFQIYSNLVAKPRNIDREQSASARLNTWQQGLYLVQKFPILGVGFNAYRYGVKEYNIGNAEFLKSHGSSSNDSSLLFVASTTGILGLIAYSYLIWTLFKESSKEKNYILIAGLGGLLIHSFFANSLFFPPILTWILLISAASKK